MRSRTFKYFSRKLLTCIFVTKKTRGQTDVSAMSFNFFREATRAENLIKLFSLMYSYRDTVLPIRRSPSSVNLFQSEKVLERSRVPLLGKNNVFVFWSLSATKIFQNSFFFETISNK